MSIVDNSKVNISTNSRQSSPEKKDFIPQQQQLPTQKMVGQTSRQQGLMRSLSAQRRIPAPSSAAKEDDSLLFNRKSANPSQRFDQTKGNNTQQSSLISEETKRSVHDLIRLKNNTMPKSTFVAPTATNSSFNTDHSFQYDTSIDQAESKHIFGRRSHAATSSSSPGRSLALHDL